MQNVKSNGNFPRTGKRGTQVWSADPEGLGSGRPHHSYLLSMSLFREKEKLNRYEWHLRI